MNVTCPHCSGKGFTEGFACPGGYREFPCKNCGQTGEVTPEYAASYELAKTIRVERIKRGVSAKDEAARLKCSIQEVVDIEHARMPETDTGRAAWAKRLVEIGGVSI